MVFNRNFLLTQGDARSIRVDSIPAYRGMITDRNGEPLAVSTPVASIWLDPVQFKATPEQIQFVANLLNIDPSQITNLVANNPKRQFVYLERDLDPTVGTQIDAQHIPGIFVENEFKRYYPDGEVTAQLVGLTDIDDQGQEGMELAFNKTLSGIPGKQRVLQDRLGRVFANMALLQAPKPGQDLHLSIDQRIQFLAYQALVDQIKQSQAQSGTVVVMDVKTGEVLAMANAPSYNPNDRPQFDSVRFRNQAVTDIFEPGSTAKAFSASNALMSGLFTPDTIVDTRPGYIVIQGHRIDDDADYGVLTVTGVLQKSSNVGATKMTLATQPGSLYNLLSNAGFGQITASGFPGESSGILYNHKKWPPIDSATMAFGYGFAVTDLQLAQAYSMLAAGGIKRPVSLLRIDGTPPAGVRVMPQIVANQVVKMMEAVIEEGGSATDASIPGYTVSGKTGTARILGASGYELNHHTAVFVGIVPATNPRLVCAVMIKDPDPTGNQYFGGEVSAPVFQKVMSGALRILNIPPDNMNGPNQSSVENANTTISN